jgi:hypothetical protein
MKYYRFNKRNNNWIFSYCLECQLISCYINDFGHCKSCADLLRTELGDIYETLPQLKK